MVEPIAIDITKGIDDIGSRVVKAVAVGRPMREGLEIVMAAHDKFFCDHVIGAELRQVDELETVAAKGEDHARFRIGVVAGIGIGIAIEEQVGGAVPVEIAFFIGDGAEPIDLFWG